VNKANNFAILWLTGMSGSGKSTLSIHLKKICELDGYQVEILDGDSVRESDKKKLGFGYDDVLFNNKRIAEYCLLLKNKGVEIVIVPVISPYESIRKKVKEMLDPFFHLIYIKADIDTLKKRDTKGLYLAADKKEITGLIGYSKINPYEEPSEPSIIIETNSNISLSQSKKKLFEYVRKNVLTSFLQI
jgi:adenylyl-sulfate kinase